MLKDTELLLVPDLLLHKLSVVYLKGVKDLELSVGKNLSLELAKGSSLLVSKDLLL